MTLIVGTKYTNTNGLWGGIPYEVTIESMTYDNVYLHYKCLSMRDFQRHFLHEALKHEGSCHYDIRQFNEWIDRGVLIPLTPKVTMPEELFTI